MIGLTLLFIWFGGLIAWKSRYGDSVSSGYGYEFLCVLLQLWTGTSSI